MIKLEPAHTVLSSNTEHSNSDIAGPVIGLYGGLANNMYVFAKALTKGGISVRFIRDRTDRFALSQPAWEDCRATLPYDEVVKSSEWSWEQWERWEVEQGWTPPAWLVDPAPGGVSLDTPPPGSATDIRRRDRQWQGVARPTWNAVLHEMRRCDALICCGVEATILAGFADRPFLIHPHGSDLRLAARLTRMPASGWYERIFGTRHERLLRRAYRKAQAVVTYGILHLGGPLDPDRGSIARHLPGVRFADLPLPVWPRERLPGARRREHLNRCLGGLGLPPIKGRIAAIVPSRVDFFWKGHDRLVEAFRSADIGDDIHLIFTGWGDDYEDLKSRASGLPFTFLPCALSKPLLYDYFQGVDFVVDQFTLGHYGSGAAEAMACGAPVMIWIELDEYQTIGRTPPPVINARGEREIAGALTDIATGTIDLDTLGREAQTWVLNVHGVDGAGQRLLSVLGDGSLESSRRWDAGTAA